MSEAEDSAILDLLMPTFSGDKDEYGKDVVPPLPLSFDRVNEGRPPASSARLLKLPTEILGEIFHCTPEDALSSMALVNRDFCQMVRSRRFASIHFEYSNFSLSLLATLLSEGQERSTNAGSTRFPSLGACIRRITVATDIRWIAYRHEVSLGEAFVELSEDVKHARLKKASDFYFGSYIKAIQYTIILGNYTLPHLELLDWEDMAALPRSFFDDLALSGIQHLKLFRVSVSSQFQIELPGAFPRTSWPLRTLYLDVRATIQKMDVINTYPLCLSILRLCAPTLESLRWQPAPWESKKRLPSTSDALTAVPRYPCLRNLSLGDVHVGRDMLLALVNDKLRALVAYAERDSEYLGVLRERGLIPSLDTFVWSEPLSHDYFPFDFLQANSQLEKLSLTFAMPEIFLDIELLPLLSASFKGLTSLSLIWNCHSISESALKSISTLQALQQIHLSAGEQFGWRHDWKINHQATRRHFSKLPMLRKIAFSRDSYDDGIEPPLIKYYYERTMFLGRGSLVTPEDDPEEFHSRWEKQHLNRMLVEATQYVHSVPRLEWIFLGQIPMRVAKVGGDEKKIPIPISARDSCWTLLRVMFGGDIY